MFIELKLVYSIVFVLGVIVQPLQMYVILEYQYRTIETALNVYRKEGEREGEKERKKRGRREGGREERRERDPLLICSPPKQGALFFESSVWSGTCLFRY